MKYVSFEKFLSASAKIEKLRKVVKKQKIKNKKNKRKT